MNVLIACGGTAGHIFPGLALVEELKKNNTAERIVVVVSTHPRDKEYLVAVKESLRGVDVETVGTIGLPEKISFKLFDCGLQFLRAVIKSFVLILRHKPDVVVGFGGYASFVPLVVARVLKIPTLIHEQNLIPGKANQLLSRFVHKVAVSFDSTGDFFSSSRISRKIAVTGLPLRRQIVETNGLGESEFDVPKDKFVVLVAGGSQGASEINSLMLGSLELMGSQQRSRLHVIHLTGKKDFSYVRQSYEDLDVSSSVFSFFKDIASLYKVSKLLIARSGASTIFEAATFGLPYLVIPYSHASGHQKENALFLKNRNCAVVLEKSQVSPSNFKEILNEIIDNKIKRENLIKNIKMLQMPQAANNLLKQVRILCKDN